MLLPDLKDLVKLKSLASFCGVAHKQTSNRTQGDYSSLFHGLGVEFETVRPYVIGDDVRYIDWRVTARSGKPHVKTFRAECDRNVLVVIDANAYMRFGTRGTFKSIQAAKTAALLCWKSVQQQDRVGGLVFGDISKGIQYFKPAKTDSSALKLLNALCCKNINTHEPVAISNALNHLVQLVTPQSLVFILSDFSMDSMEDLEKSLIALRKKCKIILLPVHDPADSDIPDVGSLILADGNQRIEIDTDNSSARKKYRAAWEKYSQNLISLSKKLKARVLWIETAVDPLKCLFTNAGSILTWKS